MSGRSMKQARSNESLDASRETKKYLQDNKSILNILNHPIIIENICDYLDHTDIINLTHSCRPIRVLLRSLYICEPVTLPLASDKAEIQEALEGKFILKLGSITDRSAANQEVETLEGFNLCELRSVTLSKSFTSLLSSSVLWKATNLKELKLGIQWTKESLTALKTLSTLSETCVNLEKVFIEAISHAADRYTRFISLNEVISSVLSIRSVKLLDLWMDECWVTPDQPQDYEDGYYSLYNAYYNLVVASGHLETLKIRLQNCQMYVSESDIRVNVAMLNCPNLSTLHIIINTTGYGTGCFCLYHSNFMFKGLLENIIGHCPKIEDYNGYGEHKKDTQYKLYHMEMCNKRCPDHPEYDERYCSSSNNGNSSTDCSDHDDESSDVSSNPDDLMDTVIQTWLHT